jgi:hypothetical protein
MYVINWPVKRSGIVLQIATVAGRLLHNTTNNTTIPHASEATSDASELKAHNGVVAVEERCNFRL